MQCQRPRGDLYVRAKDHTVTREHIAIAREREGAESRAFAGARGFSERNSRLETCGEVCTKHLVANTRTLEF